jgi:hypothetical protein
VLFLGQHPGRLSPFLPVFSPQDAPADRSCLVFVAGHRGRLVHAVSHWPCCRDRRHCRHAARDRAVSGTPEQLFITGPAITEHFDACSHDAICVAAAHRGVRIAVQMRRQAVLEIERTHPIDWAALSGLLDVE